MTAQTIPNPSFEADNFTISPGYIDNSPTHAPNGPITDWIGTPVNRTGLNNSTGPFASNGIIPDGNNVGFIQAGASGPASLQGTVSGLQIDTKYNVTFRVNARSNQVPSLRFSVDGVQVGEDAGVSMVGNNPYNYAAFEFTATAETQTISIANVRADGDHTLLVDDVKIAPSTNSWSVASWTNDGDSGISSNHVYTHAYNFGTNNGVTINGVRFVGRETGTPGRFTLTGLTGVHGGGTNHVTGNSTGLAGPFRFDGQPSIKLENLKPLTQYVFTVYGVSWDNNPATELRSATFVSDAPSSGGQRFTVSLNKFGLGKPAGQGQGYGITVNHTFTTDELGSPVTISYPGLSSATFHTSGFSNREVATISDPAPTPAWTSAEWNDDSTSGVLPTHTYTHAFNFGSAANVNINGVVFTGIPGANPTAPNYTSAMPMVYTNDLNNEITGLGEALSRDFVHSGFPDVQTLTGLVPDRQYVFTIYSTGFEAPGIRFIKFFGNREDAPVVIDQSQFGNNKGIRIEYRYTAKADGTAKIFDSACTINSGLHICGISNREADPSTGVAVQITRQPTGGIIASGSSYTLSVGATGSATLNYEWKRGATVVGGNSHILNLSSVSSTDSGKYTVTVSNGVNSVTSQAVNVSVLDHVPGVFGTGVDIDGLVLSNGSMDPHYTLVANPNDGTKFDTWVQTGVPGAWIANSTTSKWIGPVANTASANGSLDAGEGAGNYVYRTTIDLTGRDLTTVKILGKWASDNSGLSIRVNGTPTGITNSNPTGATFATLEPFVIDNSNASLTAGVNNIDFVVNNAGDGYTGLRVDTLRAVVVPPTGALPSIIVHPKGATVIRNGTLTLRVTAIGSGPLSYQWYKDNSPISGATNPTYAISATSGAINGNYKVIVTNASGDAESTPAAVMAANAAPVAVADGPRTTGENEPLEISIAVDLLSNDTDNNTDTLTLVSYSTESANGGTITPGGDEDTLIYTPPQDWPISGQADDTFTYTISDGWGGTATGTVTITVISGASLPPGDMTLTVDLDGNNVTGTFIGTPGATYILERSTTLLADSWSPVDTQTADAVTGAVTVVDSDPPDDRAFYRISYQE